VVPLQRDSKLDGRAEEVPFHVGEGAQVEKRCAQCLNLELIYQPDPGGSWHPGLATELPAAV
jgi:hypothetical protein